MMKPILLSVGLVFLGACAAEDAAPKDLVKGNAATGGTTMMSASGGAGGGGGKASAGSGAGGSGGKGMAGSSGAGAGGATAGAGGTGAGGTGAGGAAGTGTGGTSGAGGATGSGGASGGSTPGTVTLKFKTVSYEGEYAPKNYVAVWFESKGAFVKTAARWAGDAHATDLVAWNAASDGWGSPFLGGGNTADKMDAMSSATLQNHEAHTVTWNMMDAMKKLVADGDYEVVVEMTEDRAASVGPLLRIPFKKGPAPQTVNVPDEDAFTGIVLDYKP